MFLYNNTLNQMSPIRIDVVKFIYAQKQNRILFLFANK